MEGPRSRIPALVAMLILGTGGVSWAEPVGTAFTYQGQLKQGGIPADGNYDFVFKLFDAATDGTQIGSDVPIDDWPVGGGLFTVQLDFGDGVFTGNAIWLEIGVRVGDSGDPHTVLSPRQELTPAPYALYTLGGDHGSLAGLEDDDHPQYVMHDEANSVSAAMIQNQAVTVGKISPQGGVDEQVIKRQGGVVTWANDETGGGVGGGGTPGHIAKFTASDEIGDSVIYETSGGRVGIGTSSPAMKLHVNGDIMTQGELLANDGVASVGDIYSLHDIDAYDQIRISDGLGNDVRVRASQSGPGGPGYVFTYGPNGSHNVRLSYLTGYPNNGYVAVRDANDINQVRIYVNSAGDGVIYKDYCYFLVPNPNEPGTEICYCCLEGPEAAAYIRGTAGLIDGGAFVRFPDHFRAVAAEQGMTVQLTPRSARSKGLAVVSQGVDGFEVRELMQGAGTYEFDYLVMGVRKGAEEYQVIREAWEAQDGPLAEPDDADDDAPHPTPVTQYHRSQLERAEGAESHKETGGVQ